MNVEELVRESLREQAEQGGPPPGDFAGRVLAARRRRRNRTIAGASLAVAAATVVAVAVPGLDADAGRQETRTASELRDGDVVAHPGQAPPRELIAAGGKALAAYYTQERVPRGKGVEISTRAYRLLDQRTGTYKKDTRWSVLAVAPGMRTAAVLERELPARRVGLLDMVTGKVERWIETPRGAGGVEFSPDGGKLVVTTYGENPDRFDMDHPLSDGDSKEPGPATPSRTGFYVIDATSGDSAWSAVKTKAVKLGPASINTRQDFAFSRDGSLLWSGLTSAPHQQYYDTGGRERSTPANERHLHWMDTAGLSPSGKLADGGFVGSDKTTASEIIDSVSGKRVAKVPGQQLVAWADEKRLIGWDIAPGGNEYRQRLVLVTIGSGKTVPLSGYRSPDFGSAGRWYPVFAAR
ncbi:WD40 repeat domain-containing protein [Streptomyces sp. DSM 118878]